MNAELLHILQHSLGLDQYGQGTRYRNRFCTGPESKDFANCRTLADQGLMIDHGPHELFGGMHIFSVTQEGEHYIAQRSPKPPKLSKSKQRYQRFLEYGDSFDSFRDFLSWDMEPERDWNGGAA